jgi:hypothetical protein
MALNGSNSNKAANSAASPVSCFNFIFVSPI